MKMWQIKKLFNEVVTIGFIMFIMLSFLETSKREDLVIVGIFTVAYVAAKVKSNIEKNKRKFRKGNKFKNKKFEKKEKESE